MSGLGLRPSRREGVTRPRQILRSSWQRCFLVWSSRMRNTALQREFITRNSLQDAWPASCCHHASLENVGARVPVSQASPAQEQATSHCLPLCEMHCQARQNHATSHVFFWPYCNARPGCLRYVDPWNLSIHLFRFAWNLARRSSSGYNKSCAISQLIQLRLHWIDFAACASGEAGSGKGGVLGADGAGSGKGGVLGADGAGSGTGGVLGADSSLAPRSPV